MASSRVSMGRTAGAGSAGAVTGPIKPARSRFARNLTHDNVLVSGIIAILPGAKGVSADEVGGTVNAHLDFYFLGAS